MKYDEDFFEGELVEEEDGCPRCGNRSIDSLDINEYEVTCGTCNNFYQLD